MNGWIKLFRAMLTWEWYTDSPTKDLFLHCLLTANSEPTTYRGVQIPKGSFNTTEAELAVKTGLSRQQIRTAIKKLISTNEIAKTSTNGITIIKVNKYADYQAVGTCPSTTEQPLEQPSEQPPEQPSLIENKKIRREEDKNKETYKEVLDCSPEFSEALKAFEEMRRKIRKPLTDRAKQLVLKKLKDLAPDEETQIEILNQSVMNSWQGVFPLDSQKKKGIVNVLDL